MWSARREESSCQGPVAGRRAEWSWKQRKSSMTRTQSEGEHGTCLGWKRSSQAMNGFVGSINDFCLYSKISGKSLKDFNCGEGWGEESITFVYKTYLK